MRPKSTSTISISLETSQSTKVTWNFLPQVQTFSLQLRGTGDASTEIHRDPSVSPTRHCQATKSLMDTKPPAETTVEVIKCSTQEWAGREMVKEKRHRNKQTQNQNKRTHSLLSSRNSISPSPEPSLKTPGPEERNAKGVTEIPELGSPAGGNAFRTTGMTKFSWKCSLDQVRKSVVKHCSPREQAHTFNPLFLVKLWHCQL